MKNKNYDCTTFDNKNSQEALISVLKIIKKNRFLCMTIS